VRQVFLGFIGNAIVPCHTSFNQHELKDGCIRRLACMSSASDRANCGEGGVCCCSITITGFSLPPRRAFSIPELLLQNRWITARCAEGRLVAQQWFTFGEFAQRPHAAQHNRESSLGRLLGTVLGSLLADVDEYVILVEPWIRVAGWLGGRGSRCEHECYDLKHLCLKPSCDVCLLSSALPIVGASRRASL